MPHDDSLIAELQYRTSRSAGSGGQHVNKVETRVEALLDIPASQALTEHEKSLLPLRLGSRVSKEGILAVASSESRSQARNKEKATEKLMVLVRKALMPRKRRIPTAVPQGVKRERLKGKRLRAETKAQRSYRPDRG